MSKGKLVAQGAHASLEAALKTKENKNKTFKKWKNAGGKKVVLKTDLKEIEGIKERAEELNVSTSLIRDQGLTEVEPGTITALGIGPDKEKKIEKLTSSLPLL